jgi:hypothetical protein
LSKHPLFKDRPLKNSRFWIFYIHILPQFLLLLRSKRRFQKFFYYHTLSIFVYTNHN